MQITKASGEVEDFNEEKLLNSIQVVGAPKIIGKEVLRLVKDNLSSDTNTYKIHNLVSQYLCQHADPLCNVNYNLKRAIFKLGPTGYPFENYISKVLQELGFNTKVGVTIKGRCVGHEIDILAKKDNVIYYTECKFHNRPGLKTDVQVALYTYARFNDIESNIKPTNTTYRSWLISNTKITKDAIRYATCQNIKTTSWNYPAKESLFKIITDSKILPITVIRSLSQKNIEILLKQDTVTIKDLNVLLKNNRLKEILSTEEIKGIKEEMRVIYP